MRIIGQMVLGPGEADRYLEETLEEFKRLCDDVIVCTCNTGRKELKLLDKYDFRHYADDREWGKFQPDIKTGLLKRIMYLDPDWILALDADETMPSVTRETLERITEGRDACQFYVVNLWNDVEHYSKALSFYNVRFYRAEPALEKSLGTQFLRKPVHCGNAPPYYYALPAKETHVPHILLHKGLMRREDRLRKAARYDIYDPKAIHKGREYYDALLKEGSGTIYAQESVLQELTTHYDRIRS